MEIFLLLAALFVAASAVLFAQRMIFFALLFFGPIAFVICAIGAMIPIH